MSGDTGNTPRNVPVRDRIGRPLPRRFYREVAVDAGGCVLLDGRPLRTPLKNSLALPAPALAEAVAEEWRAQGPQIDPASMPMTGLSNAAIDRIAPDRARFTEEIVAYAGSDLVCYRADAPVALVALQAEHWDPVMDWALKALDARFVTVVGVIHEPQPEEALRAFAAHAATLDHFRLAALHVLTAITGSALIAARLLAGAMPPADAWAAAHVDEDFQTSQWGEDAEASARRAIREREFRACVAFHALLG
jgi:chaperone required for assembly of F1-ATPase